VVHWEGKLYHTPKLEMGKEVETEMIRRAVKGHTLRHIDIDSPSDFGVFTSDQSHRSG
jgi:hypothetical protein